MATIIAGIGASHVPAIGAALDNGKTEERTRSVTVGAGDQTSLRYQK